MSLAASACTTGPARRRRPPPGQLVIPTSLRVGIAEPTSIDPAHLDSPSALLVGSQIFDGLTVLDPVSGEPQPALGARWSVSKNGRTTEFRLRRGVRFHDGSPVRAADFVFAWNRLASPRTHSPYAFLLERVSGYQDLHVKGKATALAGLQAVGDNVLPATLDAPWPGFAALTAHPALSPVPPSAADLSYDAQPVGNGPYQVREPWGLGSPIHLERATTYYGQPAAIDSLDFDVYRDAESGWPDFESGNPDIAAIPPSLVADAESRYGTEGIVTLARLPYCGFNLDLPQFQDVKLRRAVSLALERETIAATVYGPTALPATGIVPPSIPGAVPDACGDGCRQDVDRAATLVRQLSQASRTFELDLTRSDVGRALRSSISSQLAAAGFIVRPRFLGEADYGDLLKQRGQQVFCLVWDADTPRQEAFLDPLLSASSPDNQTEVKAESLDRLPDRARATPVRATRLRTYVEAERAAFSLMPLVTASPS